MKRIPNKTAVTTICYCISGNQQIAIYNYADMYDLCDNRNGNLVCAGLLKDVFFSSSYSKFFNSECHGLEIKEGTIVFSVCTSSEVLR